MGSGEWLGWLVRDLERIRLKNWKDFGCSSVVKHLPSMVKDLDLIPSATKIKQDWKIGALFQPHPILIPSQRLYLQTPLTCEFRELSFQYINFGEPGFPLPTADVAIAVAVCLTWQQQNPTLTLRYISISPRELPVDSIKQLLFWKEFHSFSL
jgi:hypothetical protein